MNNLLNKIHILTVDTKEYLKLCQFIQKKLPFSLKVVKRSIEHGQCRVNGKQVLFSSYLLKLKDKIEFYANSIIINPVKLIISSEDVVYEDECLIAVNKPPFFPSDTQNKNIPSVISEMKKYIQKNNGKYINLLHRLDEDTTGVLLASKKPEIENFILEQFKNHKIKKTYIAFVKGVPLKSSGIITSYIGLLKRNNQKQWGNVEKQHGKFAETHYKIIEKYKNHSLIELHPLTGRTHQIRIHLSSIKCPISGDNLYGVHQLNYFPPPPRQLLHSSELTIIHPETKKEVTIVSKIPIDFQNYINNISNT